MEDRDVKKVPEAIEAINGIINDGGIAEVKVEDNNGITVVRQDRRLRYTEKKRKKEWQS